MAAANTSSETLKVGTFGPLAMFVAVMIRLVLSFIASAATVEN